MNLILFFLSFLLNANSCDNNILNLAKNLEKNSQNNLQNISNELNKLDILFSSTCFKNLKDNEVTSLFDIFYKVSYKNERGVEILRKFFFEKYRRKLLSESDKNYYKQIILINRDFVKARELISYFPDILKLPKKIEEPNSNEINYLVYDIKDLDEMVIKKLEIENGKHIVIVSAFSCGFSEKLLDDIFTDEKLRKIFNDYGIILFNDFSPQSLLFTKLHYAFKDIYLIYKEKSFKDFKLNVFPSIYFIKDGKIIKQIEGNSENLLEEFKKIALDNGYNDYLNTNKYFFYEKCKLLSENKTLISQDKWINFLGDIEVYRGVIKRFDLDFVVKNFTDDTAKICIYSQLTPLSKEKKQIAAQNSFKIQEFKKYFKDNDYIKIIESLSINRGKILGLEKNFSIIINLPEKNKKYILCELFGDCGK
ncbi:MAG: hypothetical protein ACP5SD_04845 [Elusimicrobiales bacterium]